jgi:phosphoglycolate phosphatase-like HAD superfamily hydrolase
VEAGAFADHATFWRVYRIAWLREMCETLGITPPSELECLDLADRAQAYVTRRVRAAFPGVADTIRSLYAQGYTLHTASGECSSELAGYLEGMGVRGCFGRLYGADLVNTLKSGPEYYRRVFADAAVDPADALIVDDNPGPVAWATEVGARAILINSAETAPASGAAFKLNGLAELPAALNA